MNVKELREALEGLPDWMLVILQKDGEGNGYSPLDGVTRDNASYVADSDGSGEVKCTKLTPSLKQRGFTKEDMAPKGAPRCVVLSPVN